MEAAAITRGISVALAPQLPLRRDEREGVTDTLREAVDGSEALDSLLREQDGGETGCRDNTLSMELELELSLPDDMT